MSQLTSAITKIECPSCGSYNVSSTPEVDHFKYGDKDDAATLSASICVHHCASCDFTFTAEDASEIRHEAVCRHLGVLTPTEVRRVRERHALSQAEFSELSKIGKASLARWENGVLIQNQANDNLLYLLTYNDNFERLRDRTHSHSTNLKELVTNVIPFRPKLRTIPVAEMERFRRDAERFNLFPVAMEG